MQPVFFDIPAGAFSRNSMLQEWVQDGYAVTGRLRRSGYDRVKLLAEQPADIYDLMETVTFQESVHWILQEECSHYRTGNYYNFAAATATNDINDTMGHVINNADDFEQVYDFYKIGIMQ